MGIVCLILGIIYLVKRGKISPLTASAYPAASPAIFNEWKRCELRSIDLFLVSTWGLGALFLLLGFVVGSTMTGASKDQIDQAGFMLTGLQVALLLVGLIISGVYGQRAQNLHRQLTSDSTIRAAANFK